MKKKFNFFFKSVQIYMKDVECSESNDKSNFRFLLFELWSYFYSKYGQFLMTSHDNSKTKIGGKKIIFHSFLNYLEKKNQNDSF